MTKSRQLVLSAALLVSFGTVVMAQAPLAQPLAEFDKLVSQLKVSNVVGEPIRAGDTAVVPFARVHFGIGAGELAVAFGGGIGGKTIPLGVVIVEGDDVRVEMLPQEQEKPSLLQQLVQAILDRKVLIMGNGINLGSASGNLQDLAPLVSAMMAGQTTFMGNGTNFGRLNPPKPAPPAAPNAASPANVSLDELNKLIDAKKYAEALKLADSILAKDPKNAAVITLRNGILSNISQ